jgi:PAS domain S-box-containing protein
MGWREELKKRAEARSRLATRRGHAGDDRAGDDLRTYQTELELQNEELRRLQHELRAAHDRYFDLFERAPVSYLTLAVGTQVRAANMAALSLLGRSREDLLGKRFPSLLEPAESYRFHLHHQSVLQNMGEKGSLEVGLRRPDGTPMTVRLETTAFAEKGEVRVRMALVDLSERRRSERLLRERDARLSAVLNTLIDAVITIDDQGIIEDTNPAAARLFGYLEGTLAGQPISILMPGPHRARFRYLLSRYLGPGDESIVDRVSEVPAQRRDGTVFAAELAVGEQRFENQRRYVGVIRDISERRRQDDEIRESLARLRQIAERIEDIFYIAEPSSGRLLYVSPAFTRVFGREVRQVEDRMSWLSFIHPDDTERVRSALARAREGIAFDEEYRIVRPDGSERLVRDRGFPLSQQDRITGIVHDVTDERRMEEGLRHAQRLEAVGTLASGIAHDFNNLLMGLAGLSNRALQSLGEDHPAGEHVRRILEATMRGATLTRQLLMFSGQRRAPAAPVELDAAVRATRELLGRLVGEHIRLTVQTSAPGLGVLAEPGEIEQILLNLATNARDAMPDGGELWVTTEALNDGASIMLCVRDTGRGMDHETKAHVFEPFFTTKSIGHGTGLGLSTVFAVARQRGGDVRLESEPGGGTVVCVSLPVVARDLASPQVQPETPRGTETVLVVEDDPLVRATVHAYLQALGYRAVVASDPEMALRLAEEGDPAALLLTDVVMPGRLGGELARQLQDRQPALRVLFMSAHPHSELLRLGRIQRDSHLLGKPFGQHELGLAVRAALDEPVEAPGTEPAGPPRPVLIVDDDPDVAGALQDALEVAGWPSSIALSGPEALRLAQTLRPNIVLCDLGLGSEMSGYEVARRLRADDELRETSLIAVTGRGADEIRSAAAAAGFDEVVTKPVDLETLEELVRRPPHRHAGVSAGDASGTASPAR